MTKFVTCFWGTDFCSTSGADALAKRMKDGKQMCQDFEEFIKQRADAEEKYGKSLIKLAKSVEGKDEIGTLKDSWECLKAETENIGKAHLALAQQLLDELEKSVREFREKQRETRKRVEESLKRAQRNKKTCYDSMVKAKRTYEQKCRDVDTAEENLKKSVAISGKDEERLRKVLGGKKTQADSADNSYQSSIRVLEEGRQIWEREMETACNIFQSLEEERIAFLRNEMWVYTNLGSLNCVRVDEINEDMRKKLESCSVDSDIHLFISMKQTGSERPAKIEYENYYTVQSTQKISPMSGGVSISGPVAGSFAHVNKDTSFGGAKMAMRPPASLPPADSKYQTVEDSAVTPKAAGHRPKYCKAMFAYDAQGDQEISFEEGDLIEFKYVEDDVWWCGIIKGKTGMFPNTYVKKLFSN